MPKSKDEPFKWTEKAEQALALTFAGRLSREKIAQKCSISTRTLYYWLEHPDFQAKLEEMRADFKASIAAVTFADKARRIHALNDAAMIALGELEDRPLLKEVRPTKDGFVTNEAFNNTASSEFRSALADIAAELGERKNVTELAGGFDVNTHVEFYLPEPEQPPEEAPNDRASKE